MARAAMAMALRKAWWLSGVEDGGGVEQDDIAARTGFSGKDGAEDGGVGGDIAPAQARDGSRGEADLIGREMAEGDGVAADLGDLSWAGDGDLVDARAACGGFV